MYIQRVGVNEELWSQVKNGRECYLLLSVLYNAYLVLHIVYSISNIVYCTLY